MVLGVFPAATAQTTAPVTDKILVYVYAKLAAVFRIAAKFSEALNPRLPFQSFTRS